MKVKQLKNRYNDPTINRSFIVMLIENEDEII